MAVSYRTPQDLVEGLSARQPSAREVLFDLLREPIERLMSELLSRHGLSEEPDLLVRHGLHHAETHLRFRPASAVAGMSWGALRASLLIHVAKLTVQPHGAAGNGLDGPSALPEAPHVRYKTFFRPYARLGNQFYGGDWYAGRRLDDGSVWVFLADVTGHGFYAYLLASALPAVWQRCWQAHPDHTPEPAEVLAGMHHLLSDCLPEGIFIECLLVCVDARGGVTLSPAGGARVVVRQGGGQPNLVRLRGSWLGLYPPNPADQQHLQLDAGDELVLTTDGVFDQLEEHGGADPLLAELPSHHGALFTALREGIEKSLARGPQMDDITMVLVHFRGPDAGSDAAEEASQVLPLQGASSSGRGDVSM